MPRGTPKIKTAVNQSNQNLSNSDKLTIGEYKPIQYRKLVLEETRRIYNDGSIENSVISYNSTQL